MTPLAAALDGALPQTQCRRCGYADCAAYAQAIAAGTAEVNCCPPGGAEGVARLARLAGRAPQALNPACGSEAPRGLAVIDEAWCIGCTLCIQACPVDCIVGSAKRMHTVIDAQCTGCALCVAACPVDCIALTPVTGAATGWQAWSQAQAQAARQRYHQRSQRLQSRQRTQQLLGPETAEPWPLACQAPGVDAPPQAVDDAARKQALLAAARARASARRGENPPR